jgi:hypothetical protein
MQIDVLLLLASAVLVASAPPMPTPPMPTPPMPTAPVAKAKVATTQHGAALLMATASVAVVVPAAVPLPPAFTNPPVTVAWTIGPPGTNQPCVLLQASTNFTGWCDVGFFPITNGDYSFQDTNGFSQRYYRAMTLGSCQAVTNLSAQ